jgi:hypothetical protein
MDSFLVMSVISGLRYEKSLYEYDKGCGTLMGLKPEINKYFYSDFLVNLQHL